MLKAKGYRCIKVIYVCIYQQAGADERGVGVQLSERRTQGRK